MRRSAVLALGLLAACVGTRGPFEHATPTLPPEGGVSLVLLGEAGVVGRSGEPTAAALRSMLRGDAAATVVLLGGQAPHRVDARNRPRPAQGTAAVTTAARAHDRVISIVGAAERQAGGAASVSAVLRIDRAGRVRTASSCQARTCTLAAAGPDDVVELVVLDLAAWRSAQLGDDDPLARIDAILDALDRDAAALPRVLLLELPVEGGLEHGQGALGGPTATFHYLPHRLQQALQDGRFVGVVAGGEAGVHATLNVGRAIARTEKTWLHTPVWQVVSGRASGPIAGHGTLWRRTALARGVGFRPEWATIARGFAVITIGEHDQALLDLYAHRRGKWSRARMQLPLQVSSATGPRDAPSMAPCMRCDEVPAGERP